MSRPHLTAGFLPLLDAVTLVLARELGIAEEEGFELTLMRETSWANIRDRSALGHFDIALMLAPMPIAASLGLTPLAAPIIAPLVAGLGNNAVTVSREVWERMAEAGAPDDLAAGPAGEALTRVIGTLPRKLRFGVVHQTSSHNYELRYWLAASGIRPDVDVEIVVLPPPLLPEALAAGGIDGYCVGEPWNSVGVAAAGARIVTTKSAIWQHSPDKVIGMRADWAERHPDLVAAVIRAVYRAAQWCGEPANRLGAAKIMARAPYLDQPVEIVQRSLIGRIDTGSREVAVPDFFVPHDSAANFPWKSHALWYYSQMVRWGEAAGSEDGAAAAAAAFRPDLYRTALEPLGVALPRDDYRRDGDHGEAYEVPAAKGSVILGANRFFDGAIFDPMQLGQYMAAQARNG